MLYKGFKFGMLLQLAVGPMCLMVFKTSGTYGFWMGFSLVLAIATVDALYIALAGLGISAFLGRESVKKWVLKFGFAVLLLFGVSTIAGAFGYTLPPGISLFSGVTASNMFMQGLLLTASNPMTIVFWGGVFSSQAAENNLSRKELALFGAGCVLSTLTFMTAVCAAAGFVTDFLSKEAMDALNALVGAALIYFAFRMLKK
jgi:threonine/homoserine/homoserine lactone efflux protein